MDNRRASYRLDLSIPVRYRFAKRVGIGRYKVSPTFKGLGDNFSKDGAAIKIGKPLPPKTLIYLELSFPFRTDPVLATAEILHRKQADYKGKPVQCVGMRYLVMEKKTRTQMNAYIISGKPD